VPIRVAPEGAESWQLACVSRQYGRVAHPPNRSRTSSELLGFDPDARVLILNCDDLGMHQAVNIAIVDSIENGVATSCSLMMPCPGAADAMGLLWSGRMSRSVSI
jgi:hypothetical protein